LEDGRVIMGWDSVNAIMWKKKGHRKKKQLEQNKEVIPQSSWKGNLHDIEYTKGRHKGIKGLSEGGPWWEGLGELASTVCGKPLLTKQKKGKKEVIILVG